MNINTYNYKLLIIGAQRCKNIEQSTLLSVEDEIFI